MNPIRRRIITNVASAALAAATLSGSPALAMGHSHITRSAKAHGLHFVFSIGNAERMSKSGKNGEKMLGGKMATCSMGKMKMSATRPAMMMKKKCNHHVELHVYRTKNGKVVTKAKVTIRFHSKSMGMDYRVPIMRMENPKLGRKDYHYGNNIHMTAMKCNAFVAVDGVRVEFKHLNIR